MGAMPHDESESLWVKTHIAPMVLLPMKWDNLFIVLKKLWIYTWIGWKYT